MLAALAAAGPARSLEGRVLDAATDQPLAQADVVVGGEALKTDAQGAFRVDGERRQVSARTRGYRRAAADAAASPVTLRLERFVPKAVYLSAYGVGDAGLRGDALRLAAQTEINALVIDLKGDRSIVPYASAAYAAAGIGPQSPVTVHDMPRLVAELRAQGLYLIARIVVFKDDRLADAHPAWAVHERSGAVWHDREGLTWIDPLQRDAWAFSLGVAEEAAQFGFDEVQFDYLRFPDTAGLRFAEPLTEARRVEAITAYLQAARQRLARYNVFIAADVFGYVCWNENDTEIGQRLDALVPQVDYLSPMLYPSGFTFGIPGFREPVAAPYEIVRRSLQQTVQRTGMPALQLRPWLQAFRDYAFDHREFDADEIEAQIRAAEALGTDGWMLWNAHNRYSAAGLKTAAPAP
jgi:hypothetical protein